MALSSSKRPDPFPRLRLSSSPPPRVSVCIPTYNGAAFLAETLASTAAQTVDDFEVIVVDDQSSDDSFEIAERFARSDSRVRAVRNTERAGSGAANAKRYLSLARGEWIKVLNQDDLMAPACLELMLDAGKRGPLVICWHDYLFAPGIDAELRAWYERLPTLANELPGDHAGVDAFCAAILRHASTNFIGPTSSCLVHRDCFTKYGVFDPAFSFFPDLDYWTRVGSREGLVIVPRYLVTFRVHGGSITGTMRRDPRRVFRASLQVLRRNLQFARSPEFDNVRRVAATMSPAVNLEIRVRESAAELRWGAEDDRFRKRDPWALEQWNAFVAANPEIHDVLREIDAGLPLSARLRRFVKRQL